MNEMNEDLLKEDGVTVQTVANLRYIMQSFECDLIIAMDVYQNVLAEKGIASNVRYQCECEEEEVGG